MIPPFFMLLEDGESGLTMLMFPIRVRMLVMLLLRHSLWLRSWTSRLRLMR